MSNKPTIIAADVKARARMKFLPKLFGGVYLSGESAMFTWARYFSKDYQGGNWRFAELSCGGGFMYPDGDGFYQVNVPYNGFSGRMSAEAFGMFITSMVLNHLSWDADKKNKHVLCDLLINHQELLKTYADQHPESHQFYRAID